MRSRGLYGLSWRTVPQKLNIWSLFYIHIQSKGVLRLSHKNTGSFTPPDMEVSTFSTQLIVVLFGSQTWEAEVVIKLQMCILVVWTLIQPLLARTEDLIWAVCVFVPKIFTGCPQLKLCQTEKNNRDRDDNSVLSKHLLSLNCKMRTQNPIPISFYVLTHITQNRDGTLNLCPFGCVKTSPHYS